MADLDCEYHLTAAGGSFLGRFRSSIADRPGPVVLDSNLLQHLRAHPDEEGALLFDALFPPGSQLEAAYRASEQWAKQAQKTLRFRLHLAEGQLPATIRDLRWEELYDAQHQQEALARSPLKAFSRFLGGNGITSARFVCKPRLLVAIADPPDSHSLFRLPVLDRKPIRQRFEQECAIPLRGRLAIDVLEGPVTSQALLEHLSSGSYQGLHLIAHGITLADGTAALLLQDGRGQAEVVAESVLSDLFVDRRGLRLVVLAACSSAVPGGSEGNGLARRLVHRGVPAVLAMAEEVSLKAVEEFTKQFYLSLGADGVVDRAANRARQQVYHDLSTRPYWSTPVLFMRLADGRLWRRLRCDLAARAVPAALAAAGLASWLGGVWVGTPPPGTENPRPNTDPGGGIAGPPPPPPPTISPAGETKNPQAKPAVEYREKIRQARDFRLADGGNIEQSLRCYLEALAALPDSVRRNLDPHQLAQAKEQRTLGSRSEAARIYGQLLDRLAEDSSASDEP